MYLNGRPTNLNETSFSPLIVCVRQAFQDASSFLSSSLSTSPFNHYSSELTRATQHATIGCPDEAESFDSSCFSFRHSVLGQPPFVLKVADDRASKRADTRLVPLSNADPFPSLSLISFPPPTFASATTSPRPLLQSTFTTSTVSSHNLHCPCRAPLYNGPAPPPSLCPLLVTCLTSREKSAIPSKTSSTNTKSFPTVVA